MQAADPRTNSVARLVRVAALVVAATILMWTAIASHRPPVFFDTEGYHLNGARFVQDLGLSSAAEKLRIRNDGTAEQRSVNDTLLGARSPFYGVFLYETEQRGGLWLSAFLQCLAVAWALRVFFRAVAPRSGLAAYGVAVVLAATVTSLPFFASFLLPDIFVALALLATGLTLVYVDRLGRGDRIGLWLLILAGCAFHQSAVAIVGLTATVGGGVLLIGRADARRALGSVGLVLSAVVAAVVMGQAYVALHRVQTGETMRRPPFVAARLLADGPGRTYLRDACAQGATYELCRLKDLPFDDTETILWSDDPKLGIMNTSNHDQRVRLEDQETAFVIGTFLHEPVAQAFASLRNFARQLAASHVDEPIRDPAVYFADNYYAHTWLPGMIPNAADCRPGGRGCRPPFSMVALARWHQVGLILALAFLGWRLTRRDGMAALGPAPRLLGSDLGRLSMLLMLTVVAVLINAAVCGALSGPFARYQARVVWLLPMMALAAGVVLGPAPAHLLARWRLAAGQLARRLAGPRGAPG